MRSNSELRLLVLIMVMSVALISSSAATTARVFSSVVSMLCIQIMGLNIVNHRVRQQVTDVSCFGATSADIGGGNFQCRHVCHQNRTGGRIRQGTGRPSE